MTNLQFKKLEDDNQYHHQAMNSKSYYSAKTADKHQEISPPIHEIHVTLIRENNVFL